jgi:hypothetical protein
MLGVIGDLTTMGLLRSLANDARLGYRRTLCGAGDRAAIRWVDLALKDVSLRRPRAAAPREFHPQDSRSG